MNIEHLNYFVENVIKPNHPWMDSFEWRYKLNEEDGYEYWVLDIIPYDDLEEGERNFTRYEREIENEVKDFFNMVKDSKFQELWKVRIIRWINY